MYRYCMEPVLDMYIYGNFQLYAKYSFKVFIIHEWTPNETNLILWSRLGVVDKPIALYTGVPCLIPFSLSILNENLAF